jgi:hypothetical protein
MNFDELLAIPHKRFNPLLREWVLVSPQRAERPWQGSAFHNRVRPWMLLMPRKQARRGKADAAVHDDVRFRE